MNWKEIKRSLWSAALFSQGLRRRLAFQLKHYYQEDLDVRIPLGQNLYCPLFGEEVGSCFEEIFLRGEYNGLLEHAPLPRQWLDFGCYTGFFSLWLLWHLRCHEPSATCKALLVDADNQHMKWLEQLIHINGLEKQWMFLHGAIADHDGECEFVERSYMGSSLRAIDNKPGRGRLVKSLSPAEIIEFFPGSYDLIKLDMEGAEYEFLLRYGDVARRSSRLLIEWHSWHLGGGGYAQICQMASKIGFALEAEIQPARRVGDGMTGVSLFRNTQGQNIV